MGTFLTVASYFLVFFMGYLYGLNRLANAVVSVAKTNMGKIIPIYVAEYEQGNYYLYDKDTSVFICQGKTLDDVATALNNAKKFFAVVALPKGNTFELQWFVKGRFANFNEG